MKSKNWLSDLLETTMHKYYLENHPTIVDGIKKLLIAGEKPAKIKSFCEGVAGKNMTSIYVGHMIDYVNKKVKN